MKYLMLFENHKKAESLLKKYSDQLSDENLKFIDYIKKNVAPGYVGKLTEMYIYYTLKKINLYNLESDIRYVIENVKDIKTKPIDAYNQEDLGRLLKDIKMFKIVTTLNKIKKNNSIKYNANIDSIAKYVYDNNINLDSIAKLPVHNRVHSDQDFIDILSGSLLSNLRYHKDWDVLYDTDDLLIYEILSYEGGLHLIHVNQCINSKAMYDNYKKNGYQLYNLIDKNNLDNSLFIDKGIIKHEVDGEIKERLEYSVFRWNDFNIGKIINGVFKNKTTLTSEEKSKVETFINVVINK